MRNFRIFLILVLALLSFHPQLRAADASVSASFEAGVASYRDGEFASAAASFASTLQSEVSSGALQNLGNAEWKRGRVAEAILAWERALWVDPFNARARNNLRFARDARQLEAPELAWYEVASGWLPAEWWALLAGVSFWGAVGALVIPGVLRWRNRAWTQALAAIGFGFFLLCLPAHVGTVTRANIGFILHPETPLRLTPTSAGEAVTRVNAGEPVRRVRSRGDFVFVRTRHSSGWVKRDELEWIVRP